jgi:FtsH-binding integral membrane protein
MEKIVSLNFLRTIALVVLLLSCGGCFWLVLRASNHDESVLMEGLFICWVLSPFLALAVASAVSKPWSVVTRITLYSLMIFIGLCSLVGYSGALDPPGAKLESVFLVVPLISWLLMAVVIPLVALLSHKHEI